MYKKPHFPRLPWEKIAPLTEQPSTERDDGKESRTKCHNQSSPKLAYWSIVVHLVNIRREIFVPNDPSRDIVVVLSVTLKFIFLIVYFFPEGNQRFGSQLTDNSHVTKRHFGLEAKSNPWQKI